MSEMTVTEVAPAASESAPVSSEPKEVRIVSDAELSRRAADDLDAKLSQVFEKAQKAKAEPTERPRDATGKFQPMTATEGETAKAIHANSEQKAETSKLDPKADPKSAETKPDAKTEAKPPEKPPASKHEVPKHWPDSIKAKFASLPEDLQKEVAEAGLHDRRTLTQMGKALRDIEPVQKLLTASKDLFESRGVSIADGLDNLLKAQKALDTNPVEGLKKIAQHYGIDLGQLAATGQASRHLQLPADPEVNALKSEIAELKKQLGGVNQHISKAQETAYESRVQALTDAINAFGKSKEGFEEIEADFEVQLTALSRANPSLKLDALMEQAYEAALWSNPKSRARALDKEHTVREEKRLKALADAKSANAINVTGAPKANGHADVDSLLGAIWDKRHAA